MFIAKRSLLIFAVLGMLLFPSATAVADTFFNDFWIELGGDVNNWNVLNAANSGGNGYSSNGLNSGEWFPYAATGPREDPWGNPAPANYSWMNQWFYDGEYRPDRYKIVELDFTYKLTESAFDGGTDIVINWSTPEWSLNNPGVPPTGFYQNEFIGRATVSEACWLSAGNEGTYEFVQSFDLRQFGVEFNPEWVSIDVIGYNVTLSDPSNPGSIIHHCVPEPGTFVLLAMAGVGALLFVWRKRRTV